MAEQEPIVDVDANLEEDLLDLDDSPANDKNKTEIQDRKKAFRFSAAADNELLKEVLAVQPFLAKHSEITNAWTKITENCGKKYNAETSRKRFNLLLNDFKQQNVKKLKQSGTTEEFGERERLLQDITDLIKDNAELKKSKSSTQSSSKEVGESIRDAAMNTLLISPTNTIEQKGTKRKMLRNDESDQKARLLDLMEKRLEEESEARKAAQKLEEKKLEEESEARKSAQKLEEKRLEVEELKVKQQNDQMQAILQLLQQRNDK